MRLISLPTYTAVSVALTAVAVSYAVQKVCTFAVGYITTRIVVLFGLGFQADSEVSRQEVCA